MSENKKTKTANGIIFSKTAPDNVLWEGKPEKLPYILSRSGCVPATIFLTIFYLAERFHVAAANLSKTLEGCTSTLSVLVVLFCTIGIPVILLFTWLGAIYHACTDKYYITSSGTTVKSGKTYRSLTWETIRQNQPKMSMRKEWQQDIWQSCRRTEKLFHCKTLSFARKYAHSGSGRTKNLYFEAGTFDCVKEPDKIVRMLQTGIHNK